MLAAMRTHASALALIAQLPFQVAKSMPELPHEYTVRDTANSERETAYVLLFHLIQAEGVIERYRYQGTRSATSTPVTGSNTGR
jgi:hypothetical protein